MLTALKAKKHLQATRASRLYIHQLCERIATRLAREEINELAQDEGLVNEAYDFECRYAWHYERLREQMEANNAKRT